MTSARYRENLQGEIDGAALYRTMVDAESNPSLKEFYRRLAETETRHGAVWRDRLETAGASTARLGPSWRARVLMRIARRFEAWIAPPDVRAARRLVRMRTSLMRIRSRLECRSATEQAREP